MKKLILSALVVVSSLVAGVDSASAASIAKSQRDLLVFVANLSPDEPGPAQAFYNFVEFAAESAATGILGGQYRATHILNGNAASRAGFSNKLDSITNISAVKAVDVIFVTHGLSGSVAFSDQSTSMTNVKNDILAKLTTAQRAKLRMLFSTACYGESHRSKWIASGFKTVSGSKRIYADSALSFVPFLTAWAANQTFQTGVNLANLADPARIQDNAAKGVLWAAGYSKWWDVDSVRLTSGSTGLKISTM